MTVHSEVEAGCDDVVPFAGVELHVETEQIVIWEEHFAPGEATEAHRHSRDYLAIVLTDLDLTVVPLEGELPEELTIVVPREGMSFEGNRATLPRGVVFHSAVPPRGTAHVAFNNGEQISKLLIVELKGTGVEGVPPNRRLGLRSDRDRADRSDAVTAADPECGHIQPARSAE